ncbi:winged helix-turn-helix transcriptional regulator [Candidatus Pacearchaeota archaeon]|nr:winged helix-turn-helix transcriptional regulator [Candidatus Pacearchaeota archaeon]
MAKKFDLVDLGDDEATNLAETINNKTCKKIINYLKENEASESDISKNLKIPVSTVHYNVQKLKKNNLIEAKDFYWSPKGNKVHIYKATNKVFVFAQKKSDYLSTKIRAFLPLIILGALLLVANVAYFYLQDQNQEIQGDNLTRFKSDKELINAFTKAPISKSRSLTGHISEINRNIWRLFTGEIFLSIFSRNMKSGTIMDSSSNSVAWSIMEGGSTASQNFADESPIETTDYSKTNIQVKGVDEADIIKTDGKYIYTLAKGKLVIIEAYPSYKSEILSTSELGEFSPKELFIDKDRLLVFGSVDYNFNKNEYGEKISDPINMNAMSVRLYDVSNKKNPELLKTVDFEGNYLTSRKIDSYVYFVINSNPHIKNDIECEELVPKYRESEDDSYPTTNEIEPIAKCTDIGYIESIQAKNFITIASISMNDEDKEIKKEVIVGSGQNVYTSTKNLYIAQTYEKGSQKTVIIKFALDNGEIRFKGDGEVKGHILNQFSMDEYNGNFRIATTIGRSSSNNLYVLDEDLKVIGELEGLAAGESIYSARFMGEKAYIVTFKKVDPLFVIDLSDPTDPKVLGKLKIPGYSDYLHPYDENHLIGIGKDTIESRGNFGWYQGIKMAIFDVSDVENPIEMHKVVIGDRGTESNALKDHKAFLFDKDKELLIIPITLAEVRGEIKASSQRGEITFQGAYVYNLNLEDGFDIKGRVTHYEDNSPSFNGDASIKRSLYIKDVLYTLSNNRLQLNDLNDLDEIGVLRFGDN